jgi:hypothetical protein
MGAKRKMIMAGNLVENRVCNACGADIRPQALFCYNCGSSVAPEIAGLERPESGANEELQSGETQAKGKTKSKKSFDRPIEKPDGSPVEKKSAERNSARLQSAAAIRKTAKSQPQKKAVEVVWEEPDNAPNVWFIVAALVLTLFAVGILLAALFVR